MNNIAALALSGGISQADMHHAIGISRAAVSRLWSGDLVPSKGTIDKVLGFFSEHLERAVTYEEVFGPQRPSSGVVGGAAVAAPMVGPSTIPPEPAVVPQSRRRADASRAKDDERAQRSSAAAGRGRA